MAPIGLCTRHCLKLALLHQLTATFWPANHSIGHPANIGTQHADASENKSGRHPAQTSNTAGSCSSSITAPRLTLSTNTDAGAECHRRAAPWDVAPQVCCCAAAHQSISQEESQAHTHALRCLLCAARSTCWMRDHPRQQQLVTATSHGGAACR